MAVPGTVKTWQPFASIHLRSARAMYEKAVEIESQYRSSPDNRKGLKGEHIGYATGAVFAVVAFLEAFINETFLNAVGVAKGDLERGILRKLPPQVVSSMAHTWETGTDLTNERSFRQFLEFIRKNLPEHWYVLDKYQLALYLADKYPYTKPFDQQGKLWGDMTLLTDLRDLLTHHKSEWIALSPEEEPYKTERDLTARLLRELSKREFANPLCPGQESVLNFLGSRCASWALSSSVQFVNEFEAKMPLDLSSIAGLTDFSG